MQSSAQLGRYGRRPGEAIKSLARERIERNDGFPRPAGAPEIKWPRSRDNAFVCVGNGNGNPVHADAALAAAVSWLCPTHPAVGIYSRGCVSDYVCTIDTMIHRRCVCGV